MAINLNDDGSKISKTTYKAFLKALQERTQPRKERTDWLESCLVSQQLEDKPNLTDYEAFRDVFSDILEALRQLNPDQADILQWRFWDKLAFKQISKPGRFWSAEEMPSDRTLAERQKQAVYNFAALFLQKEKGCQDNRVSPSPAPARHTAVEKPASATPASVKSRQPLASSTTTYLVGAAVSLSLLLLVGYWGLTAPAEAVPMPTDHSPTNPPMVDTTVCGESAGLNDAEIAAGKRFLRHQGVSAFTIANTPDGILNNRVRAVTADKTGLWVGYFDAQQQGVSGLTYLDLRHGASQKVWRYCGLIADAWVNDIAVDHDNQVWVATDGGGVWTFEQGAWQVYNTVNSNLPDDRLYQIIVDAEGYIWVGSWEGVAKFNKQSGQWAVKYNVANGLFSNHVHALAFASNGDIWVGHISDGVSQFDNKTGTWVEHRKQQSGLGGDEVRRIAIRPADDTSEESIWFATLDGGVSKFEQGQWTVYGIEEGLPSQFVNAVMVDRYNRVWAATDNGTVFLDDQKWTRYNAINTLAISFGADCQDESCASSGDIWTGTQEDGLTHSRLPHFQAALDVVKACFETSDGREICQPAPRIANREAVTITYPAMMAPEEEIRFKVTVRPRSPHQLRADRGDFLANLAPTVAERLHVHPVIPVQETIDPGQSVTFANDDTPLKAPPLAEGETQKSVTSSWRVWMKNGYVGPTINLVFRVTDRAY